MKDSEFVQRTQKIYDRVFDAFDEIDPDLAEADESSDNVRITFANGVVFVLNRQRPLHQVWLATKKNGYHFNLDEGQDAWICDKTGKELFSLLAEEISGQLGKPFKV
ncbi:MAG: iron donor protein CyaY [bacterium]|nr:iron donor protein CyaY [bacterium]